MTLADTRPVMDPAAVTADVVGGRSVTSTSLSPTQLEMMRAFFCDEFEVDGLDADLLPEATPGAVAEWVDALAMSGLFAPAELDAMSDAWFSEPRAVISLLAGVDEVAARRGIAESAAPIEIESPTRYLRAS